MSKTAIPKIGERVELASRFITKADKLLDVGCGEGIIQYFIGDKVKNLYGIDNSKSELRRAEARGFITKQVNFDSEKFPFMDSFFDVVTCLDVIEHVKNPKFLLGEIHRVLRPDGKLIISTPNIRFWDHIFKLIFKGRFPKTSEDLKLYDGGHIHFFTFSDLRCLVNKVGFGVLREEGIINKSKRGWKGRFIEKMLGKRFLLEFRSPGILMILKNGKQKE